MAGLVNADNTKGVTDRSGTAGQTITYEYQVKNYAKEAINVTGTMTANNTLDTPGPAQTKSIAGNDGQGTFAVPVNLGPAPTANRSVQFSANAVGPKADAAPKTDAFTVHQPANLDFSGLNPTRVRSGFGSAREFNITTQKTGGAAFELTNGALHFAGNTATLKDAPQTFAAGTNSRNLTYQITEISGNDGDYNATITSVGQDDNLANYSLSKGVGLIIIDNIIPTFDIPLPILGTPPNGTDVDGDKLVAAKNGTRINVSGKALGDDLDGSTLRVALRPDAGAEVPVTVTQTDNGDSISFSGQASPNWDPATTRFTVVASIADDATNVGTGTSGFSIVDLAPPVLDDSSGVVQSPTTIRVQFDDATGVRGGCDPRTWLVDDQPNRVSAVYTSAGQRCDGTGPGAEAARRELSTDGVRILHLSSALGADDEPDVTYTPGAAGTGIARQLGIYLSKDGAQNDTLEQTIQTVTDLVPPPPDVLNVRRHDHETGALEPAVLDEGRYYTNNGGEQAIRASITGVRDGYLIQVVDGSGNVVHEEEAQPQSMLPLASEWTQDIDIPLGTDAGQYTRGVQLVSRAGNASLPTLNTFVIDLALPTIGSSVLTAPDEAMMYFSEKIVAGADTNENWFATWTMQIEDGSEVVHTQVKTNTVVDNMSRRMGLDFEVTPENFVAINYLRLQESSARYEDRAGNYMLNTLQPVS